MRIFHGPQHRLHAPAGELDGGVMAVPHERAERMARILARLAERGFPAPEAPAPLCMAPVEALHDSGYLDFLATGFAAWRAAGHPGDLIATSFPVRRMAPPGPPGGIDARAGYYAQSAETAITEGTWMAAQAACACAQAAQRAVAAGARAAFALARPPGHHAARDYYGGYCFLNNAAVAAQMFRDAGAARVAVLDIDVHHGNGTQDIFWQRGDVLVASLHGDPDVCFPHFSGFAAETGAGAGAGATLNLPMPEGTGWALWAEALEAALGRIAGFGAEALVVSLGVDAYAGDPIGVFRLEAGDFRAAGRRIGRAGLPTVFCMEGGYAVEALGVNTVNVLEGFLDA